MVGHPEKPERSAEPGYQRLSWRQPETDPTDESGWDVHRQPRFPRMADSGLAAMPAYPQVTGLGDMLALVRRNTVLILLMILLSLGAGIAYAVFAPPRYIASAMLLIDPASSSVPEEYYIESQTQMMRSDLVVRTVIEQLDLVEAGIARDDSSFLRDHVRAARQFVGLYIPVLASDAQDGDPVQGAVSTLRRNLTIMRPAMTPVISITYNSTDPDRAANIVNALVDAYTSQRRRDEAAGTQQSVAWLAQRLDGLRHQLENSERTIEDFRIANNIVGAGTNHSLKAEQRLYELGMQRDAARAAAERARARHGITRDTGEGASDAPIGRVSAGSEIAMLSMRDATAKRQQTESRLDVETDAMRTGLPTTGATGEADPIKGRHQDSNLDADLAEALKTQASLEQAFEEAARRAGEMNRQRARLRELEASAAIYRTLYGNMLQRYEEAVQQGSLPANDGTRVLIAARRPDGKSQPRSLLVLAFAGAFGAALGVGTAILRTRLSSEPGR